MKIAVLKGTSRKGNYTEKVTNYVVKELAKSFEVVLVDPKDHLTVPVTARSGTEIEETEWSRIMAQAQGLVIVAPEYNHGYTGELKLILDQLYNEYLGKPVLVCAVSDGEVGGARMVENLLPVLVTLGLYPLRKGVYFHNVDKLFNDNGELRDENVKLNFGKGIGKFKDYLKMLGKT